MTAHKSESPAATGLHAEQTKPTRPAIVDAPPLARNEFDDLRGRFARRGWWLQRVRRADDGRTTYHLTRNTQTRVFGHPHDLAGFLAVVEGSPV
jgi:hypothetical protein